MKGRGAFALLDVWLLPLLLRFCVLTKALLPPGPRLLGVSSTMAGIRRRTGQGIDKDNEDHNNRHGVGMVFWNRRGKTTTATSSSSPGRTGSGVGPSPTDADDAGAGSVIHLGKLRIPRSRRISFVRAEGDPGREFAVSDPPLLREGSDHKPIGLDGVGVSVEGEEELKLRGEKIRLQEEERRERERKIEVDAERVLRTHSFIGGPSVIPYGMGEDQTQRGVVQIPLKYTVGQTVDFIRTVASVDRDFRRSASDEKRTSELLHGDERLPAALTDRIYVTEDGKLRGYITMAALLTHQPNTPVLRLLRTLEELLREGDSWEEAAHRLRLANVMAAPVVDDDGVLVAVLNPSDLLHEMEIEATDDIMRQSGSGGGESYFGTPLARLVASRVGWLVGLLCLQSFSSLILQSYQKVIERNIVIALFLTMLTGTAGNAGNQSSAIVIRGLATGEIHRGNRFRVVWREARAALASAAVLSFASFVRVSLTPGATPIATLAVAIAMGATVVGAVMFGTVAPIVLHGMGVDPVNFASPALATLTDVSGVYILCSVAKLMLGASGT